MFVLTILRNNLPRLWLTDTAKPTAGRGGLAAVPALAGLARAVLLTGLTAVLLGFGGAARAELDKALIQAGWSEFTFEDKLAASGPGGGYRSDPERRR